MLKHFIPKTRDGVRALSSRLVRMVALTAGLSLAAFGASGCASIVSGTSQHISVDTSPSGASCTIMREGNLIHPEASTPLSLSVKRDKDPLVVTCVKEGYAKTTRLIDADLEVMAVGNIIAGGPIGLGVDAATGALREYPANTIIPMQKE